MWEWCDHLRIGKSSVFVKKDLRPLPLTDAEFKPTSFSIGVLDQTPGKLERHVDRQGVRRTLGIGGRAVAAAHSE